MKAAILSFCLLVFFGNSHAQPRPGIAWQKTFGGPCFDYFYKVIQTSDGGFIMVGATAFDPQQPLADLFVVKTDPAGLVQWQRTYGGSGSETGLDIKQTPDGGYIIGGETDSDNGNVTGGGGHGGQDIWIIKINATGIIQWQKCYGALLSEYFGNIELTPDGGYIFTGTICSPYMGGQPNANHGECDVWVVKINQSGTIQWDKCYGGTKSDNGKVIKKTTDGGFVIFGMTESDNGDVSGGHGYVDLWILKIGYTGTIQWQRCYGGTMCDYVNDGQPTSDGGYIIAGRTESANGDVTGYHGGRDYWVVKTDATGEIQWQRCYGGSGREDYELGIIQTSDGGFALAGCTESTDGDVSGNHGGADAWIVKTASTGNIQWQQPFGDNSWDGALCIIQTAGGNLMFAGDLSKPNSTDGDAWAVMLCSPSPLEISVSDTVYCDSTTLTATAGFAGYSWNTGDTSRSITVNAGGSYDVAAYNATGCPSGQSVTIPGPLSPFEGEKICLVTCDSATSRNVVVVEKTLYVGTDSVHIYRQNSLESPFQSIGAVSISDPWVFTDPDANPCMQQYRYKISLKDECGAESGLSELHGTIFLQAVNGPNQEVNLSWTAYEGFGYSSYEIYRSNIAGIFLQIATVPAQIRTITDSVPPEGINLYQVRVARESQCVEGKSYQDVRSNLVATGIIVPGKSCKIFPNPGTDRMTIAAAAGTVGTAWSVSDQGGRIMTSGIIGTVTFVIDISGFSPGLYYLKLGGQTTVMVKN